MRKAIELKLTNIIDDNEGNKCRVTSLVLNNSNKNAPLVMVTCDSGFEFFVGANTEIQTYNESAMFGNY